VSAAVRVAALAAQAMAIAGAFSHWLADISGVQIALTALTEPGQQAITRAQPGAGWIVVAAAAVAAAAALAGNRGLVVSAAAVQLIVIVDFNVLEGIRRAPGNYDTVNIAPGCWIVLTASVAGILIGAASTRARNQSHQGADH